MSLQIVVTGAGSGGHITPILAVAAELKRQQPDCTITYIGQRGDKLGDIPAADPNIDAVSVVRAGKFRRYHGEGIRQLLDIPTLVLNARDAVFVLIGIFQSYRLLKKIRPDIVFVKGGFVGVPVGLAAAKLGIPYITHDSDAIPGLANRIISRWARKHAVALPAEVYPYEAAKTITTGIPVQKNYTPVSASQQEKFKKELNMPANAKLLFVIGGGLGAQRINEAVATVVPHLLASHPNLYIAHGVGRANEAAMQSLYDAITTTSKQRVDMFGYSNDVYRYSGAADIVVTRAGATNLAEFATQGKACIIIPHPNLSGGHQLKNAQYLAEKQAAIVIDQDQLIEDPNRLARQVDALLNDPTQISHLGGHLAAFAQPDATKQLAKLIVSQASQKVAQAQS